MKRFAVSIILGALAIVIGLVGLLIHNQSQFAVNTVQSQLTAQGITFTPVAGLSAEQKKDPCLVANAGKPLTTGSQAECYANYQIANDLLSVDQGKTYAQASYPARMAEIKLAEVAGKNPHDPSIPALSAEVAKLEAPASTLFQGEALRGMLLTTYGFSHMGDLGNQAATTLFVVAGLLLVAAVVLAIVRTRKPVASLPGETASVSDRELLKV